MTRPRSAPIPAPGNARQSRQPVRPGRGRPVAERLEHAASALAIRERWRSAAIVPPRSRRSVPMSPLPSVSGPSRPKDRHYVSSWRSCVPVDPLAPFVRRTRAEEPTFVNEHRVRDGRPARAHKVADPRDVLQRVGPSGERELVRQEVGAAVCGLELELRYERTSPARARTTRSALSDRLEPGSMG